MHEVPSAFRPLYDPTAVQPMRDELTRVGFDELRTPQEVDAVLGAKQGTALLVINSVCGCAAGNARPGVMLALQNRVIPDRLTTVFAGQDRAATERARSYIKGYPPSSPCIVLFQDGEVEAILERHAIEGRSPQEIASDLVAAFDRVCRRHGPSISREEFEKIAPVHVCGSSIPRAR
jgi:putative YphP/YqiW family bacilliredoxin